MSPAVGIALIVAPSTDLHARAVYALLKKRGRKAAMIDVSTIVCGQSAYLNCGVEEDAGAYFRSAGELIRGSNVSHVWIRRTQIPVAMFQGDELDIQLAIRETRHLFNSLISVGFPNAILINDPYAEFIARSKPLQLATARRCGLRIPRTWFGTDVQQAAEFVRECRVRGCQVIVKHMESSAHTDLFTRVIPSDDSLYLEPLASCPAVLQEFVPGPSVRASVVGNRIFAAEIQPSTAASKLDWRREVLPPIREIELPCVIRNKLSNLMSELRLKMGMIDLQMDNNGEPAFLEVNPQGQFLFVELQTKQRICESIANLLSPD